MDTEKDLSSVDEQSRLGCVEEVPSIRQPSPSSNSILSPSVNTILINTMSGIVRASSTGDGLPEIKTDLNTCTTVECQTVTSHGNAALSDAALPTVIKCNQGYSLLGPSSYTSGNKEGVVHIPIAAPIAMVINPALLQNIVVKFSSTKRASIENVWLYYDTAKVASANPGKSSTFYVSFSGSESAAAAYSYADPKGICLTLDINFPDKDASISLSSVELIYLYK
ncbi:hypothetical protein O1611_g2605 [Lasiodiplodia mahajangana]|uniref:Uncharacterized protein n=1 Tax=Lasiodiplodia mahajangana TaxID=1108764 RepID=A0ACC2JUF1_9PEZI|nr:hypothetical protein O1611_g2605 [Lasiodiplodia mahajangana]